MKLIIIIALILTPIFGFSQNGFPEGTYSSKIGDIIIRNDSVISEGVSYFAYYYSSDENFVNGVTTVVYLSEDKDKELKVVFKSGTPRHLAFNYRDYSEESFNVAFISGE